MVGLIRDMSSEAYHSHPNTFSSSQLKTVLEDPEMFYRKYITKEVERESNSAFDIGTYFHTSILEPDKLQEECAVYTGIRRGKEWEAFKKENKGKAIITASELEQADNLVKAVRASSVATTYLSKGEAEISCFAELYIYMDDVYCKGRRLTLDGWLSDPDPWKLAQLKGLLITIKVRADLLGDTFILDLKSTTGNVKNEHQMRTKISMYSYDLSASLYLDIFSIITGKVYDKFIWTFASKDHGNCKNYLASKDNVRIGRAKWMKAVLLLAENIKKEWKFEDTLSILEPQFFEREYLKIKGAIDL